MSSIEQALLHYLLADKADTRETVLEWIEECGGDRAKAAVEFASKLYEDLVAELGCKSTGRASKDAAFQDLVHVLLFESLSRANMRRVATVAIDRLVPKRLRPVVTPSVN